MDPLAEQKIQTILEHWREMDRGLESERLQIKRGVKKIKRDVRSMKKHVEDIKEDMKDIKRGKNDAVVVISSYIKRHLLGQTRWLVRKSGGDFRLLLLEV